jgi:hypothetical protein
MFKTLTGSDLVLIHGFRKNSSLDNFNKQMHQTLICSEELGLLFYINPKSANNPACRSPEATLQHSRVHLYAMLAFSPCRKCKLLLAHTLSCDVYLKTLFTALRYLETYKFSRS